jgi:hypothetical protein
LALLALVGWAVAPNLYLGISLGASLVLLAACTQWCLQRAWLVLLVGPAFIVVVFFLGVAASEAPRRQPGHAPSFPAMVGHLKQGS